NVFNPTPPPGVGLNTLIENDPADRRLDVGITAVRRVALTYVVESAAVPMRATEPGMKFVPVNIIVKAGAPAVTEFGLIEVSVGAGLSGAGMRSRRYWTLSESRL